MNIGPLRTALGKANVRAFLHVIRFGESSQDDSAYFTLFGGGRFNSILQHPNQLVTVGRLTSTAAGAYQFLYRTWKSLEEQYGFPDFSPEMQDLGAVALIQGRKALDDVIAGNLESAIKKCAKEWASLPGSPYNQPVRTMAQCKAVYLKYGGTLAESPPITKEAPVAPIILPLLQAVASLIPQLGQLFGSGSEVANRNVAAGTILADTLVKATESVNLQEAVEKIQSDPDALRDAKEAIAMAWPSIAEAGGGGVDGARKAASSDQPPFFKQAPFWVFILLLPLVYMLATSVLFNIGVSWSDDVKMMVATALLGIISIVGAFFFGSSIGSQKKDALLGGK